MKNLLHSTVFRIVAAVVILVLVTWGAIALLSRRADDYRFATASRRDLYETVSVTGSVTPNQQVTLAFNMQGRVAAVTTDVGQTTTAGQVLASLDIGSLQASLMGAEADVQSAQAKLTQLQRGARPEELALYQQKYNDASSALIVAMKDAYLQAENALSGKIDTVFTNGTTANPVIIIRTQNQAEKISIDEERFAAGTALTAWKTVLSPVGAGVTDTTVLSPAIAAATDALTRIKTFVDHVGTIANNLSVGNSGQAQSQIDAERAMVNAAGQQVTGASSAFQAAEAAWSGARDSLTLEQAGSTAEDIQSGQAAVSKAQSVVSSLQSQIRQSEIISPFAGTVTAVSVKVGEVYVPGISADEGIGLESGGSYKIEVYVPETDIGKIQTGQSAAVTSDGYGPQVIFPAHVSLVDPAQTVQNGVTAYKVTITFDNANDPRIKSGLTANVVITTRSESQVLSVPTRAIITRGSQTFVLIKKAGNSSLVETPVTTDVHSGDGYTQILSGLNEGDQVAGFGQGGN